MAAIADSSPLNYLVLIDADRILPAIFGRVVIPEAVSRELQSAGAPSKVSNWISQPPTWLSVEKPSTALTCEGLESLGAGEREAIALALQLGRDACLLIDEARGRQEAKRLEIHFIGTLGILSEAAVRGLIDLPAAIGCCRPRFM